MGYLFRAIVVVKRFARRPANRIYKILLDLQVQNQLFVNLHTPHVQSEKEKLPVLFSLYVNDLLSVPNHCHAMGYVDDTKIFLSLPPNQISEAVIALNEDILAIARWCCTNSPFITLIRLSSRLSEFRRLRVAYHLFRRLNYWAKKLNLYLWPRIWV